MAYLINVLQPNLHVIKALTFCQVIQHKYALGGGRGGGGGGGGGGGKEGCKAKPF